MRLKFSEFLALASFIGWFINYMKFKKTSAKWLCGLVCLGSVVYIIFSNNKDSGENTQSASTSGNNSPATIQSATTTGSNSPVIQAAPGATVIVMNDVLPELDQRQHANEDDILVTRTFWILREKGATITLGPCPGERCFEFELGDIETLEGVLVQRVLLSGEGFKDVLNSSNFDRNAFVGETNVAKLNAIVANASPVVTAGRGAAIEMSSSGTIKSIGLPLATNAFVEIYARAAFIRFTVLDTRTDSLKIRLDVKPPTPMKF